jgi:hypothetical protein
VLGPEYSGSSSARRSQHLAKRCSLLAMAMAKRTVLGLARERPLLVTAAPEPQPPHSLPAMMTQRVWPDWFSPMPPSMSSWRANAPLHCCRRQAS